jgi:hypothetical protein
MADVNKRKCFCVRITEMILNFKGGELWKSYRIFVLFFFFISVSNFCVLLAECADWLVMQKILFLTEIDYAALNRQLRYWS